MAIRLFNYPNGSLTSSDKTLASTLLFSKSLYIEDGGGGDPDPDPIPDGSPLHIGTPTYSIGIDGFPDYSQAIGDTIIETDGIVPSARANGLTALRKLRKSISVL